jgi:hypothetical protein
MMGGTYPRKASCNANIIPGSEFIRSPARQGVISKSAAFILTRIDFCRSCQNVSLTCRHFASSLDTFHRWFSRFNPYDLTPLEEVSIRPHYVRSYAINPFRTGLR